MSKTDAGNHFEDFALGQVLTCPTPRRIGEGEVASYIALCGDRTPRFCGSAELVHPLLTFHQVIGHTVRQVSLNAVANLGYAGMVWRRPVRVGAVLRTTAEVIGLKENSNRKAGIVWVRTSGCDEQGEVLSYVRWVMVRKRSDPSTPFLEAPVRPELPGEVAVGELTRAGLTPLPNPLETGGRFCFEDYTSGERIHHVDGHTVTAGDHMAFTRLFQNSARVHFDARLGEPLVYGGYVMSVGYAQAFNGFENRLGIAALNAGAHANPVHAGDTLYSFSDVLACEPLDDAPVGALRCRLVVVKNENPLDDPERSVKTDGRHHPSVVLDLDFWELMRKRES